ncbi:hypothetical protein Tco_0521049 [Tanacetum coccineum]
MEEHRYRREKDATTGRNSEKPGFGEKPYTFHYPTFVLLSSIVISSDLSFSKNVKMIRGEESPSETQEDNAHQGNRLKGLVDFPIILEAHIEGYQVRRIYVDRGSSSEVMYEHYFRNLGPDTKAKLRESRVPLGPTSEGRVTHPQIRASESREILKEEGTDVEEKQSLSEKHPEKARTSPPPKKDTDPNKEDKGEGKSVEAHMENKPPEKVTVNDDHPDQSITIEGNLSIECRAELIKVLRKHADAFA